MFSQMELSPIRSRLLQYAHAADVPPLVLCLRCKDLAIDPHRPEVPCLSFCCTLCRAVRKRSFTFLCPVPPVSSLFGIE